MYADKMELISLCSDCMCKAFLLRHLVKWAEHALWCDCMQAQFVRAENNVKELSLSVDLMKKESQKLLERSVLAERDMKRGLSDLK